MEGRKPGDLFGKDGVLAELTKTPATVFTSDASAAGTVISTRFEPPAIVRARCRSTRDDLGRSVFIWSMVKSPVTFPNSF